MQLRSSKLPRLAAAALLVVGLGGCLVNPSSGASEPHGSDTPPVDAAPVDSAPANVLPKLEKILPDLVALGGDASPLAIVELNEESCLDTVQDDDWNTETRALAWALGRYADHEAAQATMDAWKGHLESQGWVQEDELRNGPDTNGDVHVMRYHNDGLRLLASYDHSELDGNRVVDVVVTSSCTKNPDDHQMIRSKLDPDYGISSQYYDSDAEKADPA